jgi:hypothetical protein
VWRDGEHSRVRTSGIPRGLRDRAGSDADRHSGGSGDGGGSGPLISTACDG